MQGNKHALDLSGAVRQITGRVFAVSQRRDGPETTGRCVILFLGIQLPQLEIANKLRKKLDDMVGELEKSKANSAALRDKLKKAETDPKIPKEKLEQIRKEAEASAKKEAEDAMKADIEEAKKRADTAAAEASAAKLAAKQAQERFEEAQKKLKTASPEVAAFKSLFDSIQTTARALHEMVDNIRKDDPETADKLSAALKAFGASL